MCSGFIRGCRIALLSAALLSLLGCSTYRLLGYSVSSIPDLNTAQGPLSAKQASNQLEPLEVLAINDDMTAYFDRYISRDMPQQQRARMLHLMLRGGAFLGLEYNSWDTLTAEQAFNKGSANCVGFTNLYIALARYYGLDARYQLTEQYPQWNKRGTMVSKEVHVSSILILPHGTRLQADIASENRRINSHAMVISDAMGRALFYNNLSVEAFSSGDLSGALGLMAKAILDAPHEPMFWSNLGVIYRHNNQSQAAERVYLIALDIDADSFSAMNNLASLYQHTGQQQQLELYLSRIDELRNQNPYYHYYLAESAQEKKQYRKAIAHVNDAIALKQDDPDFHKLLSALYYEIERLAISSIN